MSTLQKLLNSKHAGDAPPTGAVPAVQRYQPGKTLFNAGKFVAPAPAAPAAPATPKPGLQKLNQDNTMSTPHIKTASEATPERLAAVRQYDTEQAFEMGFAKAAHDLGLNEKQYAQFYQAGLAKLAALQK